MANFYGSLIGFGAGGHSKVILDIIKIRKEYSILGLIDKNYKKINSKAIAKKHFKGIF